jgi:exodeoxyribonuclease VII small subunit
LDNDKPAADSPCEEMNFERSLEELEAIVHELEEGQLGLAEALERYEQGVKHLTHCYRLLEAAERKVELLTSVADDGTASTESFDESSEPLADSAGRRKRHKRSASSANGESNDRDIGA